MRLRTKTVGLGLLLGGAGLLATVAGPAGAQRANGGISNQGVGIYSDASTAMQMSTFTINPRMVSCGVGTVGGMGFTGPFGMLMYSTSVDSYRVDSATKTITATGRMRSITKTAGGILPGTTEDVMHDFTAIAVDKSTDRYDLHFRTPFWNSSNPMCTRSDVISGGCRFGGDLLMGEVTAG